MSRASTFDPDFKKDLLKLKKINSKLHVKVLSLIMSIDENPMEGEGKPEALKYDLKGLWSRRIDHKHRLIYEFDDESITYLGCFGHYGDK